MGNIKKNKWMFELILMMLGTTSLAIGITFFIAPTQLVTGGVTGIAIIVENLTRVLFSWGIPIWFTNLIINIPLFAISIKQRGFDFGKKSLFSALFLTFTLWYTELLRTMLINKGFNIVLPESDLLLVAVFGGLLIGIGLGLVLRASATTGGTDTLATILQYKYKNIPIAKILLGIDSCIILSGMFIFGFRKGMYALICVFVVSKTINNILEGMHFAKAVFIISEMSEEIAQALMVKIPRGATGIKAKGMYTKKDKDMLFVVVSQKEVVRLRDIVSEIDEKAFITIADVREVLGEGFTDGTNKIS